MAIDVTLSTKNINNILIPVAVPDGWTPSVNFRNSNAPTNSFTNGFLSITITAADAIKYHGIDFFVTATNSGVILKVLHGQFTTPSEIFNRPAKLSDINAAVSSIPIGGTGGVSTDALNTAIASEITRANSVYGTKIDVTSNTNVIANLPNNYVQAFSPTNEIIYNGDGLVSSVTEGGITTTYTYNANGTVNTETRNGKARVWSYDANGNPIASVVV